MRALGFLAMEYEIVRGVDLLHKRTQLQLLADIRTGRVAGVMLATPCTTLSRARRTDAANATDRCPGRLKDEAEIERQRHKAAGARKPGGAKQ